GFLGVLTVEAASVSSISINLSPQNPAPHENTNITLNSYANNLDTVPITWYVNGTNTAYGIGKKTFSVNAPAAGSQLSVVAHVGLPEGAIDARVVLAPSVMVVLWQANDSYVPPFYRGKAMPVADS